MQGIKLLPVKEGREMYLESGCAEACAKLEGIPQVQCERKALYKWYQKAYKASFKTTEYLSAPEHKLGRILKGMYGGSNFWAINVKSGAWEKILYALATIPPIEITHFDLLANSNDPNEVEIAMVSEEALEGTYASGYDASGYERGVINLADYAGLNFKYKNGAEFDAETFESERGMSERFAKSGINFGAMVAKGRDEVLYDNTVRGGTAAAIFKFVSACTPEGTDKYGDPTENCRDNKKQLGRIWWYA